MNKLYLLPRSIINDDRFKILEVNDYKLFLLVTYDKYINNSDTIANEINRFIQKDGKFPSLNKLFSNKKSAIEGSIEKIRELYGIYKEYVNNLEKVSSLKGLIRDKTLDKNSRNMYQSKIKKFFAVEGNQYIQIKNKTFNYVMDNKLTLTDIRLMFFILMKYQIDYHRTFTVDMNDLIKELFPSLSVKNYRIYKSKVLRSLLKLKSIEYDNADCFVKDYYIQHKKLVVELDPSHKMNRNRSIL